MHHPLPSPPLISNALKTQLPGHHCHLNIAHCIDMIITGNNVIYFSFPTQAKFYLSFESILSSVHSPNTENYWCFVFRLLCFCLCSVQNTGGPLLWVAGLQPLSQNHSPAGSEHASHFNSSGWAGWLRLTLLLPLCCCIYQQWAGGGSCCLTWLVSL